MKSQNALRGSNVYQDDKTELRCCLEEGTATSKEAKQLKAAGVKHLLHKSRTSFGDECKFCHSFRTTQGSGPRCCYINGKLVDPEEAKEPGAIYVHEKCAIWAPQVYFEGDTVKNLEVELKRASKLICKKCGKNGAALGCYSNNCKSSFHVPCAADIPDCRWDCVNIFMLCPAHASEKLPCDDILPEKEREENILSSFEIEGIPRYPKILYAEQKYDTLLLGGRRNLLFMGSSFSESEKKLLDKFVSLTGVALSKKWRQDVTHVISSTNSNGACKKTHEVLMAIATGKWILSIRWMESCLKFGHFVPEELFEVDLDIDGFRDGPKKGRLRAMNKAPKILSGLKFCFSKYFTSANRDCLEELAVAAGGTLLKYAGSNLDGSDVYFVYSEVKPRRCDKDVRRKISEERCREGVEMSNNKDALVVGHSKFLNAIADSDVKHLEKGVMN